MKIKKKYVIRRILALFMAIVVSLNLLPLNAEAGTYDSVTISFRVFDESTNQVYALSKTDTVGKGSQSWQSANYRVPNLSSLVPSEATFGRVTKVTGNVVQTYINGWC